MQTTIDSRIKKLLPGGRLVMSESNGIRVVAERSGDGKTLRIIRESDKGFSVILKAAF